MMKLTRRLLPGLALALPAAARAQAAQPADYRWKVMRNGTEIGSHNVTFSRRGEDLVAYSDVTVIPRVLGVVVYRFEHRYTEVTRAGRFVSVESRQNRNGRITDVRGENRGDHVTLQGPEGTLRLPADAAPLSWWEPQRYNRVPLFGSTTGKLMDITLRQESRPGGITRWTTAGEVEAVLDYDASGRWVGYSVKGDDGSTVLYAPG
ncbi:hypothetical protein EOD42_12420 [Rhodovarius crocodyli]|uniref:DUF3108 domain-containing protein n=1 Tax=Rhodovarius crocodyli TaxID=1979269 RepID=A0A437MEA6_9PROT|nr:DUF6134 family protein [Rhodovarius crocodyli]RVT95935.1 hypothetical protein EOD42_12420 [Rhodovarius crocodyli]